MTYHLGEHVANEQEPKGDELFISTSDPEHEAITYKQENLKKKKVFYINKDELIRLLK